MLPNMRILLHDTCLTVHEKLYEHLNRQYPICVLPFSRLTESVKHFDPHVVLLDERNDGMKSTLPLSLIDELMTESRDSCRHVLVLGDDISHDNRLRWFRVGIDNYLELPLDLEELDLQLKKIAHLSQQADLLKAAQRHEHEWQDRMETLVREVKVELSTTRNTTVFVIAKLAESRSTGMGGHLERIRDYCDVLSKELYRGGFFSEINDSFIENLYWASPLHDVGKIIIPDSIINKQERLTTKEFEAVKRHSVVGADVLQLALEAGGNCAFLSMAVDIARYHHERFNGDGYPYGITGERIPLAAQIVAVADVFDAMTTSRVYKSAMDTFSVKRTVENESGRHFNPRIVAAFTRRFDAFLDIHASNRDATPENLVLQDSFFIRQ